jgi:hypothetical protein
VVHEAESELSSGMLGPEASAENAGASRSGVGFTRRGPSDVTCLNRRMLDPASWPQRGNDIPGRCL